MAATWSAHIRDAFHRFFSPRKIIVIHEEKVRHIPLSMRKQVGVAFCLLIGVGWLSYTTGLSMAHQEIMDRKQRQLSEVYRDNLRHRKTLAMIRRDLSEMAWRQDGESQDYARFVLDQYGIEGADPGGAEEGRETALLPVEDALLERVAYLENRLEELEGFRDHVVASVQDRLPGTVEHLKNVIRMTGLSPTDFELDAEAEGLGIGGPERHDAGEHGEEQGAAGEATEAGAAEEDEEGGHHHDHDEESSEEETDHEDSGENEHEDPEGNEHEAGEGGHGGPYVPIKAGYSLPSDSSTLESLSQLNNLFALTRVTGALPLAHPMPKGRLTSHYGYRRDPFTRRRALHTGIDFAGPGGMMIMATAPGRVTFTGRKGAYGNLVVIDHGHGITTRYGHLSKIHVRTGEEVQQGQKIARQGNTGRSTGAHLHYEVRHNGRSVDPYKFLKAGRYFHEKLGASAL